MPAEETPDSPLEKIRDTSWGKLALTYFVSGFVLLVFASDTGDPGAEYFAFLLLVWSALFYFIPAFVAWKRRHHQTMAIAALNLFAGWTVIGWIGSFIWSLTAVR